MTILDAQYRAVNLTISMDAHAHRSDNSKYGDVLRRTFGARYYNI